MYITANNSCFTCGVQRWIQNSLLFTNFPLQPPASPTKVLTIAVRVCMCVYNIIAQILALLFFVCASVNDTQNEHNYGTSKTLHALIAHNQSSHTIFCPPPPPPPKQKILVNIHSNSYHLKKKSPASYSLSCMFLCMHVWQSQVIIPL